MAELLTGSGSDWLLLDTEHAPNDLPMVLSQLQAAEGPAASSRGASCKQPRGQLQAAEGGTAHPIVRPPWNDAVLMKRYLDAGVQSFLIPYVQDADEARAAVAATRYPPRGIRGFASALRASRYARINDYYAHC